MTRIDDVSNLRGYEDISTSSALGKIAQDANGGKATALVHANDKSYDELLAEYRSAGGSKAEIAEAHLHAVEVGSEVVGVSALEIGMTGAAAAIAGPVAGLAFGLYKLAEANQRGRELSTAVARDEQRVALLTHLAIPDGFRSSELGKYDHAGKTFQSMNQKMTSFMAGQDHALVPLLQLHCDQGMNSAQDMIRSSVTDKGVFLAAHPDVAKRYADDQAFKEGFDAMLWAHDKGGAEYAKLTTDLGQRDARYNAAGVTFRV
ncbi:MAG TPA: hypothetical protein VH054_18995 [Polyangiaceae bacterium]|jgi:hypothetical protein|nr:hypothetical protein [Polyangiaceae bacterium]